MCPPALRKLRTYDVVFSNDACVEHCCLPLCWSETSVSAVSSGVKCRKYKGRFALIMNIKSYRVYLVLYLGTQWMRSRRRSQFEHDHRQRADRTPQITASFTRDRRRAHWHIWWGKLGRDRNCAEMVARVPCACRPEGSLSTGQSRGLVKP